MDEIDTSTIDSPYVGLQPYRLEDSKYFFGRERDSRVIASNLFASPLTVLYGSSGVGKSSVLQAGVIPLLRSSPRTVVISFQRWPEKNPIEILKSECLNAIRVAGYEGIQIDINLPFDEFLLQATQAFHGTIPIILDQFEEYFLYHPEAKDTFDSEFALAVNREEIDANFLIALREDSLSMLDRFRARIPNLLGNSLRLRHLDEKSAREAICKPLEVYNQENPDKPQVTIEENLANQLIQDVRAGKLLIGQGGYGGTEERAGIAASDIRVEAPFLQLVLKRLWDNEIQKGSNILRFETLNELGGAMRIVQTHLDHVMNKLPLKDQEIASNIFRFLVTPSGTKIAYTVQDLTYYYNESTTTTESTETLEPVLNQLTQGNVRVLRRVALPGEPSRYEIYHDVLATAILDWRARYEKDKELNRELAKARAIDRKQIANLLMWALRGVMVDFIWIIFCLIVGGFLPLLYLLLIISMGAFAFRPGLRKVTPPLSKEQIQKITRSWSSTRILLIIISFIIFGVGLAYKYDENVNNDIFGGIFIGVGLIISLLSGPIGGLWAYWRIRRREGQESTTN